MRATGARPSARPEACPEAMPAHWGANFDKALISTWANENRAVASPGGDSFSSAAPTKAPFGLPGAGEVREEPGPGAVHDGHVSYLAP